MKTTNGISTRMRNLMNAYIGKTYNFFYNGYNFMWSVTIKGLMDNTGYFITEINDGKNVWQSNASHGEVKSNVKNGLFVEA